MAWGQTVLIWKIVYTVDDFYQNTFMNVLNTNCCKCLDWTKQILYIQMNQASFNKMNILYELKTVIGKKQMTTKSTIL